MQPFAILTPSPIVGYGYDVGEFWMAIDNHKPRAIILDGGSTDPGPYMLGSGKTIVSRQSYVRDLTPILDACALHKIKLLVGSAGGAGTNAQVDMFVDVIRDISQHQGYRFVVSTIKFRDDRTAILEQVRAGRTQPCGPGPQLTEGEVTKAEAIVAQMGAEPFLKALENQDVDIIVAGRSYDPAPFAAFNMHCGVTPEAAWHMGKIVECGGLCTVPKGRSIVATMYQDSFVLTPVSPRERCTPLSVAAHTLYEKSRPDRLPGPGGVLHLDGVTYQQQPDQRSVLVRGSRFVPTPTYQIKLEGAEKVGYRTIFIGGIRDPTLIRNLDTFLESSVRGATKASFPTLDTPDGPGLVFHVYGKNAVMGPLETAASTPHEVGVMGEVVAQSQEDADSVASAARINVLHLAYPDQVATAGNLASPLTPLEQPVGPVYKFSLYHLMDVESPHAFFHIDYQVVGEHRQKWSGNVGPSKAALPTKSLLETKHDAPLKARKRNLDKPHLTIADVAAVVRSKNAGPYEITLDVIFDDAALYRHVRDSRVLDRAVIRKLYQLADGDITTCMFYEPALGWKFTFKRPESQPQGSVGERDTFGAQLHAPLLDIEVPKTGVL
ncbi:hypothetical protein EDB81DRAFT_644842 [Dactylonectria macrodidyma]|uniref:Uncharacterized protein n=1 Tax=Dactylonectria macrodidyma TaxID=307937 RepID=A0A9P9JDD9_9HYPO|nr:hypothetical protein EDB81DRAFT_644842 [Dactylonectria macrodidyma]